MSIIEKILKFFKSNHSKKDEKKLSLFDVSEYERPGHINYKKCPNCGVEANTNSDAKDIFGLMTVSGHTYLQSWCKECRKTYKTKEDSMDKDETLFS